jgi:hypothetical protein
VKDRGPTAPDSTSFHVQDAIARSIAEGYE